MELEWDDELAEIAQGWANQCNFAHDTCRLTSDGCYDSVGQNIAYQGSTGSNVPLDWEAAITAWYDEIKDYSPDWAESFRTPDSGAVVGHFTQVVWATTHKIGCGYIKYYENGWYKHHYVCNYAVGGNLWGASVYVDGAACSQCPSNSECSDSLCKLNA